MPRQDRQAISADFIGKIAVRADPVGADEDDVDLGLPHQGGRRGVGDQRARDPRVHQLPHRESRALEQRSSLVHVDVHLAPLFMREVDRREGGTDAARRQCAGVAVGQHVRAIGKQREPMFADAATHGAVLFPDRRRFGTEPFPQVTSLARRLLGDPQHARERPTQVHRGRAGGAQQRRHVLCTRDEVGARRGALVARGSDEAHRGRNADQRRAAHLQLADRIRDRLRTLEIPCQLGIRKRTLIDDAHRTRRGP